VTGTRGWVVGKEGEPDLLADATARGAGYFADPVEDDNAPLKAYLATNADLVWSEAGAGKIWRLRPPEVRKQ